MENKKRKAKCIVITIDKKIPILEEITITSDNFIYLNTKSYSDLDNMKIAKDNKKIKIINLDNNIYAVSSNEASYTYFYSPEYKNIEINGVELWGDVVIIKIINDKVYDMTNDEIDYYIQKIYRSINQNE